MGTLLVFLSPGSKVKLLWSSSSSRLTVGGSSGLVKLAILFRLEVLGLVRELEIALLLPTATGGGRCVNTGELIALELKGFRNSFGGCVCTSGSGTGSVAFTSAESLSCVESFNMFVIECL